LDTSSTSSREDAPSWLRLTLVPGVSPGAQRALLNAFGTPDGVVRASRRDIAAASDDDVAALLTQGPDPTLLEDTLRWLDAPGHHLVALSDAHYPRALLQISDPPAVLYVSGRSEMLNVPAFAIVGSRNATPQGTQDAEAFGRALSQAGLAIVSGLALGIDSAAHRGGLAAAASSIAVMGTGPDIIYPRRNRELAEALAQKGCLVSEFPLRTPSVAGNFPRRNRLISGLARGVLVVEAALASGSLITARYALEQGRDVFAIPGSIHSPVAKGCHWLIKQGAKLVESADDILGELRWIAPGAPPQSAPALEEQCDPLLEAMGFAPMSIDQMAQRTGLGAAKLAAQLSRLEIEGRVAALAGGWFQRVKSRVIE
jgi:DNA processing protein